MNRKPRKDSKLHNLPPEQRARVDKWLFDKGLTYQQVAEGCLKMFGLELTKSSVGRYYERQSRQRVELAQSQRRGRIFRQRLINTGLQPGDHPRDRTAAASAAFCPNEKPLKRLPPSSAGSTGLKPGVNESEPTAHSLEAGFQELLAAITKRAMDLATYLTLEWDAEASRELLRLVRALIAARRERTLGLLAQSERRGFQLSVARECLRIGREHSIPQSRDADAMNSEPLNLELQNPEPWNRGRTMKRRQQCHRRQSDRNPDFRTGGLLC